MADTQSIKDRLDIVQLIGEYVTLKRAGVYWKACCPFHKEKTPSFMVHQDRQFWKCFGCGKGGDIFSFVQEIEGLEFPEALRLLADKAGVKIETYHSEINKSQRNRIVEINQKAAYFFNRFLLDMPISKDARLYLERRQLKPETIAKWEVGYMNDQWDLLTQYFLKKGIGIDDLVASGLTIKKDGATAGRGYFDRFRGRIMFPIRDVHGAVVGFTGRQLIENPEAGGKYMNTPQTLVYDKSRVLYGLYQAKTFIKEKDLAVIVEGQMDVIACHQAGMQNVVAASGTALTIEQVKLLKRYSNNVAIAFDADKAGVNAAKRGIDVALAEGLNVRVIQIPEGSGKDADECLKKNPEVWFKAVENATDIMQWFFNIILIGKKLDNPKEQQAVSNELLPLIGLIPYAVERDFWMKKLAEHLGTDIAVLREDLQRLKKQAPKSHTSTQNSNNNGPQNVTSVAPETRAEKLLERLLMLIVRSPGLITNLKMDLPEIAIDETMRARLYFALKKGYNSINGLSQDAVTAILALEEFAQFVETLRLKSELEFTDWSEMDAGAELKNTITELKEEWMKKRRHELSQEISQAEKLGDAIKLDELLKQFQSL